MVEMNYTSYFSADAWDRYDECGISKKDLFKALDLISKRPYSIYRGMDMKSGENGFYSIVPPVRASDIILEPIKFGGVL